MSTLLSNWPDAISKTVFVPDPYRSPSIGRRVAAEMLRTSADELDLLVELGLPASGEPGGQLFDPNDLYNLGMYSGTGRTQPELAFKMLFRFTTGKLADLFTQRRWKFVLELVCPDCTGAAPWEVHEPTTAAFNGTCDEVSAPLNSSSGTGEYSASVTTAGAHTPLLSPRLREICNDYLNADYRWHMLPEMMQFDYAAVHELGVTNCIAASLLLARRFHEAGYRAQARRGWFCGVLGGALDLPHAWVEVIDDDEQLRVVDLATAQLARRISPETEPFQELCLGSAINRVVPSSCPAEAPLAVHHCAANTTVRARSVIRPVAKLGKESP